MKKTITTEVDACDISGCGSHRLTRSCLECDTVHCREHQKDFGILYPCQPGAGTSYDGYYCLACDTKLRQTDHAMLHQLYLAVQVLEGEILSRQKDFKRRQDDLMSSIIRERKKGEQAEEVT